MKLQEISAAFNSRYNEIYDRIGKHMSKVEYILNTRSFLVDWNFNPDDKNLIIIHTYDKGWGGCNDEESWDDIECKYLENDEVFEKWLNENYANKKAEEIKDAEKKAEKDSKFQENFE